MGMAEFKEKLGNRGSIRGEKTFNTSSGTRKSSSHDGTYGSYQGKVKGATKHIKPRAK